MPENRQGQAANGLKRHLSVELDRAKINLEKRTVELAFSSEEPVERWGEMEVLSHEKGEYDFSRVKDGTHPLLLGHNEYDPKAQIGVIESARVDGDEKKGRAVVRFSKSPDADLIFNDVVDGIRRNISVGYDRTGIVESKKSKDGVMTTRYRWMPTHIAIVPVPADTTVGVGRDKETPVDSPRITESEKAELENFRRQKNMKTEAEIAEEQNKAIEAARKQEREAGEAREKAIRENAKEISTRADEFISKHGKKNAGKAAEEIRKYANEAIEKGTAAKDFSARAMEYIMNAEPEKVSVKDVVDSDTLSQFSVVRAIQQAFKARMKGNQGRPDSKELEGEVIDTYEQRLEEVGKETGGRGFTPEGFVIPPDVQFGNSCMSRKEMLREHRKAQNRFGRDMQATIFGAGGAVVPTIWMLPYIELLRNKSVLNRLGTRSMAGLTGNVIIPRLEAPSTAYSLGEIAAVTTSQQTLGQLKLSPHRVSNAVYYSKQLVFQSSPDIENLIREDMLEVLALKKDLLGINGQGAADEPLGILNTPGIGAITFGGAATYAKIVDMETTIRQLNVRGTLAYASTSAVKGALKKVAEALTGATTVGGAANAIWKGQGGTGEEDGIVNGCQAVDSQQIPNNQVLAGVFNHLIEAMFGGFDTVVDLYTKVLNAEVGVVMNLWLDFGLRHPQAICASTDAGNQ